MVALGALSYLLELDGQKSVADHYDQTNRKFINYFLGYAKVSNSLVLIKSLICLNCYNNNYAMYNSHRMQQMTTIICSTIYLTQHGR